jgi:hypothetical protein
LGTVLENFGLYMVYNAHSGEPFTRRATTGQGDALEDIGTSRLPWVHSGDIRVTKGIDILGDLGFEVFATVENFLDVNNIIAVNSGSGETDVSGIERRLSASPTIPEQYRTDGSAAADFPVAVSSLAPEFRSRFARQDDNGDGVISLAEAQENFFEALVASGSEASFIGIGEGDSPFHYGAPRLFRFGAEIRW